jgi:hypothetical protein
MQYKGEDLDLRVPHGRTPRDSYPADYDPSPGNGRWARSQPYLNGNSDPLWVDDVLLACCNYAYDVAQANGAAEVGLEHLVNALTRVDSAARTLEARGVREGQLRRESATLIASEIPTVNAGEAVAPRRSGELEEVLRRATELASRRAIAAGVDDVLWILLHFGRELPVVAMLRRLTPDWQRTDWGRTREGYREPPLPEPASRPVPLVVSDTMQARMASIEDGLRLIQSEFAAERKQLTELVRDIQRDVVAQRGDGAAFRNDLGQRLEGLERTVQMRPDLARLPSQLTERLTQLEHAVNGSVSDGARHWGQVAQRLGVFEAALGEIRSVSEPELLVERISSLEKAVHGGLGEGARNWAHLDQRLGALEKTLDKRGELPALEGVIERISALEKSLEAAAAATAKDYGDIGQRLVTFRSALDEGVAANVQASLAMALKPIDRRLETIGTDTARQRDEIGRRIEDLGRIVEATRSETLIARSDLGERLASIESWQPLGATPTDTGGLREVTERLGGLERAVRSGFGETATTTGQIVERLFHVERGVLDRPRDESDTLAVLEERLGSMERILDARGQQALAATSALSERLALFEKVPTSPAEFDWTATETHLGQKFANFETSNLTQIDTLRTSLGDLMARLDQIDERLRTEAGSTEEALRGRDQDFDFIYGEIKQLGQSQATLNSAVNDWRHESQEHFGTLASRLDRLNLPAPVSDGERPRDAFSVPVGIRPGEAPAINGTAHKNGHDPRPTVDEAGPGDGYYLPPKPERGFRYWLFGTHSVRQSNRGTDLNVGRMRQNIKDARDRRRTQV